MEPTIFILSIAFFAATFFVCGKKGLRLFLSLALTLGLLIWVITPLIVSGRDPEIVVFFTGLAIVSCIIYLTEGWTKLSHISIAVVAIDFIIISALIHFTVSLSGLTGITSTDTSFLGLTGVDLESLLGAGIMLGTLGILTEMVVTQVATVIGFIESDRPGADADIYKKSYTIGIAHLGSIINTLFLVYAGVSFPLLIIYVGAGSSLHAALNYEPLASEAIRMLDGTIGLIIAMPIATFSTIRWFPHSATDPKETTER
jgi:uncharacterized membrane protein